MCGRAVPLYERAARSTGAPPSWREKGRLGLMGCPDYFPLRDGSSWVHVDSLSGGKNMRLVLSLSVSTGAASAGTLSGAYYAGAKRFRDYRRAVAKEGWGVWETRENGRVPILLYPFRSGRSWTVKAGGKTLRLEIDKTGATVRTKAGEFSGCLRVKESSPGDPAWVYDYYCPGVGRVKTSIGVFGRENPNTELASFVVPAG